MGSDSSPEPESRTLLCRSVGGSHLQAATEVVDARVRVDAVVDGVGVAFAVLLVVGGGGGGGLDGGHRLPHSHVRPVPKGLDGVPYRTRCETEPVSCERQITSESRSAAGPFMLIRVICTNNP